ncbi:MAG: phospho-sugar mutase [Acidimicrobiales bacterium]
MSDEALRARARAWRDDDPDAATRAEVDALLEADDEDGLRERFDGRLQFGTAGLRGALGAGPNRMNRALVRQATAGVAAWLEAQGLHGPVVVGRDARHLSPELADDTARVLAGAGFPVLVLPRPLPTPVTAFATRHLGAVAGIMITASHNPPQDNGYKLYLGDGAQIVPPVDQEISSRIDAVQSVASIPLADGSIEVLDDQVVEAYLRGALALVDDGPRDVAIVYTAMHGVGADTLRTAFTRAGFPPLHEVTEQIDPDPDFPTVSFPNPEEPGALDLALALARRTGADLVLANDPDADRLGIAIPSDDGWRSLTGDEIGALLADHLLGTGEHGPSDVVATTVVSSRLLARLASEAGVSYGEALTGFKWVVRTPGPSQHLLFGYEEALGYCVGELVRDKDGVTAALVAATLAARLRSEGSSMGERLDELARAHGVHVTRQRSIRLQGSDWLARVTDVMGGLRSQPPTAVAGRPLLEVEDLAVARRFPVPADVLVWTLDGARAIVRPSGTEPKLKCYVEVVLPADGGPVDGVRRRASAVVDEVLDDLADVLRSRGL